MASTRVRRLAIVVGAVLGLAALACGAYFWRQHARDEEAIAARDAGLVAAEEQRWAAAVDGLRRYIARFGQRQVDADVYLAYARAVRKLPAADTGHLTSARDALQRALAQRPGDRAIQDELLEVFHDLRYAVEALALVEQMLRDTPADARLLATRCEILEAGRRLDEALAAANEWNRLAPADGRGWFAGLRLRLAASRPVSEILEWVDAAIEAHPDDALFELLRACALSDLRPRVHDDPELLARAKASLDLVVERLRDSDEPFRVTTLALVLDRNERFDEALAALRRVADTGDERTSRELARRLWFAGRGDELGALVAHWRERGREAPAEVLALQYLALRGAGGSDAAEEVRTELRAREDAAAHAWAAVVDRLAADVTSDPGDTRALLDAALAVDADCPLLLLARGDVQKAAGELDLALASWGEAARAAPAWALPLRRTAEALLTTDRRGAAIALAEAGVRRAPRDPESYSVAFRAYAANADQLDATQRDALLERLRRLPAEDAGTARDAALSLEMRLLARSDPEQLGRRMRELLAAGAGAAEGTLLDLAELAERQGLPFAAEFLDRSEAQHGATPRLALSRALSRIRAGDPGGARDAFDRCRSGVRDAAQSLPWRMAHAALGDALRAPDAGRAWLALAAEHPAALEAQIGALASPAVWSDHDGVRAVIARLRELTGPKGVNWRVAESRLTLADAQSDESALAAAAESLNAVVRDAPGSVEARLLLAGVLERLGNLEGAEEQLEQAEAAAPGNSGVGLERARIAARRGHTQVARQRIDAVLGSGDLAPEQIARAAAVLAEQGEFRRSAQLLAAPMARADAPRSGVLLLAQLYARLGLTERALAVAERLLDHPDLATTEFCASLLSSLGRDGEARALLARLDDVDAEPGARELVRARHAAVFGRPEAMWAAYRAAVAAAPSAPGVWGGYLDAALARGAADEVRAILDDERASALPALAAFRAQRDDVLAALPDLRLRPVLREALGRDAERAALLGAVASVLHAAPDAPPAELAKTLRAAAQRDPRSLALPLLAADVAVRAGDVAAGVELAAGAARAFPLVPEASRQWAELLALAGRWPDAIDAGLQWRDRDGARRADAELFVATAMLRGGRAPAAAELLAPRVAGDAVDLERDAVAFVTYAVARVLAGGGNDVFTALGRASTRSRGVCGAALGLDVGLLPDARTTSQWMRAAAAGVRADDVELQAQLARGWATAWERFRAPELLAEANAALSPLTARDDAPPDALFAASRLAQESGDLAAAERHLRRLLAARPDHAAALNNIAMVLADSGRAADALPFAQRVVELTHGAAECLDTLAYVLRKGGRAADATPPLREAVRLDPSNPSFLVHLAENLAETGDGQGCDRALAQVAELQARGTQVGDELRARIAALRESRD